jgi:hypothetical protein
VARKRPTARAALSILLGVVALSACSSGPSPSTHSEAGVTLLVAARSGEAMDMGIRATLAITPSGCVGLAGPDGSVRLAIWPKGSRLVENGAALRIGGDGPTVQIGDSVEAGGGSIDLPSTDYSDIPASCSPGTSVTVVTSVSAQYQRHVSAFREDRDRRRTSRS